MENEFKFPIEWFDDNKANALFGPFRPKSIDPVAWESKMKFWRQLILNYLKHSKNPCFCINSLKSAFTRNGKIPACLDTVVEEMLRSKTIVSSREFLQSESTLLWLVKFIVKAPFSWAFNKIQIPWYGKHNNDNEQYIFKAVADDLSEEINSRITKENRGKLMSLSDFKTIAGIKDEDTILIILKKLTEQNTVAIIDLFSETVLKFAEKGESKAIISEKDKAIYQMERNRDILMANIESLESDRENAFTQVKTCLKTNKKLMAKSWLRRKKQLETYIDKRTSALDNLEVLLDQLKQVDSDAMILDSYRIGAQALKKSLSEQGITEESAEKARDELEDVLDITRQLEETLSRPLDEDGDADLEVELSKLLEEEDDSKAQGGQSDSGAPSDNLDNLPDVPDYSLNLLQDKFAASLSL